jgi:hypothetical protein
MIMEDFVNCTNELIKIMKVRAEAIVNIDETNVDFDMPSTTTLNRRGHRTISITGSGRNQRATILLGMSLSGENLPLFIVFQDYEVDGCSGK